MNPGDDLPPAYSRFPEKEQSAGSRRSDVRTDTTPNSPLSPHAARPQTSFPSPPASATPHRFPVSWTLYKQHGSPVKGVYYIAANDDNRGQALFAISQTPNPSAGQPNLTLHNGPSVDDATLATGERHKTFTGGIHSVITLPGSGSGISPEEPLRTIVSWPHISYAFDVDVGTANPENLGRLRRETFEWRHSAGSAVGHLGAATSGWKLTRMSTEPAPGVGGDWPFTGGGEFSSDGREM